MTIQQNRTLKTIWTKDTAKDFTYMTNTDNFCIQFLNSNNQQTYIITKNYTLFFSFQIQIIHFNIPLINNLPVLLWITYKNANSL